MKHSAAQCLRGVCLLASAFGCGASVALDQAGVAAWAGMLSTLWLGLIVASAAEQRP